MNRREFLKAIGGLLFATGLTACTGNQKESQVSKFLAGDFKELVDEVGGDRKDAIEFIILNKEVFEKLQKFFPKLDESKVGRVLEEGIIFNDGDDGPVMILNDGRTFKADWSPHPDGIVVWRNGFLDSKARDVIVWFLVAFPNFKEKSGFLNDLFPGLELSLRGFSLFLVDSQEERVDATFFLEKATAEMLAKSVELKDVKADEPTDADLLKAGGPNVEFLAELLARRNVPLVSVADCYERSDIEGFMRLVVKPSGADDKEYRKKLAEAFVFLDWLFLRVELQEVLPLDAVEYFEQIFNGSGIQAKSKYIPDRSSITAIRLRFPNSILS